MWSRQDRPWCRGGQWVCLLVASLTLLMPRTSAQGSVHEFTTSTVEPRIAAIALSIKSRAIQDSRCYLMNGGAVESFFISEDTAVGSVIGTLSVNGDPDEDSGNISLRLQEKNAAVGIAPGTKNLTLLRPLDREEKTGPSNVYVNVRCDRRRTSDPSFIIPVSVRVWDVNDNAPQWIGAPYTVRISELTSVGSRVLQGIRAADADQPGPHATVHYSVLPSPHSEYFGFLNELDSVLVVKKPLDFETLPRFSIGLRASDQGNPPRHNDTTLAVELVDADDQNPAFLHPHYSAVIPEGAKEGIELETSPGRISAADQDVGINAPVYFSVTGEKKDLVTIDKDSGRVYVTKSLLEETEIPATVVIKATQYDNADRYALATLTVSRRAAPLSAARPSPRAPHPPHPPRPLQFSQRSYITAVAEDAAPGAVLLTLHTNSPGPLQFYVSDRNFLEKFAINSAGEVLLRRALDYEQHQMYHYQVMVTDSLTNDTASLNITVLNVNEWEPRFRYPEYQFRVEGQGGGEGLRRVGQLEVFDGDKGDYVTLSLRGPDANLFYINDAGELFMRSEALSTLNSSTVSVMAAATDSGAPPRQSTVPVVVHIAEELLVSGVAGRGGGGGVVGVFAAALAMLALLVLSLLGYIYRHKRLKHSASKSPTPPQKSPAGLDAGAAGAAGLGGHAAALPQSGSLLSVSAGASTILAASSSSLERERSDHKSSPVRVAPPQRFQNKCRVAPRPPHAAHHPSPALMSDHLTSAGGRSGVAWPADTIPARVKKLSWDQPETHKEAGDTLTELHDATNPTLAEHMNLTVYF